MGAASPTCAPGPLTGVRVVEMTQVMAGPFAGTILADLGADIVKVEKPRGGDDVRTTGPAYRNGDSLTFVDLNRGKRSVTLDLRSEGDRAALDVLIGDADVFLHNLRPDAATSLHLDGDTLSQRFPRLIPCEVSGFGTFGPRRWMPAYESIVQAYSGLSTLNGYPEGPPVRTGVSICDLGTGMWAALGVLAALHRRERTGAGGVVSASLLETALLWSGSAITALVNRGQPPERHGNVSARSAPDQTFETADAPIVIAVESDEEFARLAAALGVAERTGDQRFASSEHRVEHRTALASIVGDALLGAGRSHWLERLQGAGIACAPVNQIADVVVDAQVEALGMIRTCEGATRLVGLPLQLDGRRPRHRFAARQLGADNAWLDAELARIRLKAA